MPEESKEIYTGKDQWKVNGAGRCEYCKKKDYCTENFRKGGCRVRRNREWLEKTKKQIEAVLSTGATPEDIGVTRDLLEQLGIEYPQPESAE